MSPVLQDELAVRVLNLSLRRGGGYVSSPARHADRQARHSLLRDGVLAVLQGEVRTAGGGVARGEARARSGTESEGEGDDGVLHDGG